MSSINTLVGTPNPNTERLANDIEPDLLRITQGIRVEAHFTPTLSQPEHAVVTIYAGPVMLDTVTVPAAEGYAKWQSPALWSERYAEAVR